MVLRRVEGTRWWFCVVGVLLFVLGRCSSHPASPPAEESSGSCKNDNGTLEICITKDCVRTATMLIEAMDLSVDPCKNFYQFTCGGYIRNHPVPDNEHSLSSIMTFADFYNRQFRDLIEDVDTSTEPDIVRRAQEAYHVCLNTTYQPQKEFEAFKSFINNTLGGWPYADGDDWTPRWSLEEFLGRIQRLGFSYGFGHFIYDHDLKNITKKNIWMVHADRDESSLIKSSFIAKAVADTEEETGEEDSSSVLSAFKTMISDVAQSLRPPGVPEPLGDKQKVLWLQAQIIRLKTENSDVMQNVLDTESVTFKEMNEIAEGKIDWLQIINTIFEGIHTFSETDTILTNRDYVKTVSDFLSSNSIRALANYIVWKVIYPLLPHGGPEVEKYHQDFMNVATSSHDVPIRWKKCTDWIQESYMFAATKIFVNKHVDLRSREMVGEMINMTRDAYKKSIQECSWLDAETKRRALIKADAMKQFVSYPDFIFDPEALENYYDYIPSLNSVHFNNVVDSKTNATSKEMRKFFQPGQLVIHKWTRNPLEINAFFDPMSNSIWFPAGILQLPNFDPTRPAAVNFGMTGSTIGHEIGHGFDNTGSTFDEYGQLQDWWTSETRRKYNELTECYVNQYSDFCPEELQGGPDDEKVCVKGEHTLGENIADETGMKAAFMAYKQWVEKYGAERRLPGLEEYSPEQIFFISHGYNWCENIPTDKWIARFGGDEHSPGKYRTNGVLQNMEEFAETFHCPVGTMNRPRAEECHLW